MPESLHDAFLDTLALAVGVPVADIAAVSDAVRRAALDAVGSDQEEIAGFQVDGSAHLACRFQRQRSAVIVLGPFRRLDATEGHSPVLDSAAEERARELLRAGIAVLAHAAEDQRQRVELATQLEVVGRAALAITGELSLTTVLRRIVDLTRELAGARYAALGVPDEHGNMLEFITSGMSEAEEARIAHRPVGRGILGMLLREPRTIRLVDLAAHPASSGFPANHPPMKSFLGVPIVTRGRVLGNLYLTEKRSGPEFSDADARVVELLARHAAVAIENARLYQELEQQQRQLQAVVDHSPEAILVVEAVSERVTMANRQVSDLLGWDVSVSMPLDAMLERNQRLNPDGSSLTYSDVPIVRAVRHGDVTFRREMRIGRADDTTVTVLLNAAPLRDEQGRVTAAVAIFQDITQIKDAEQLKDDFLALVSHELRTPLTTVQGGALLLQRDWDKLDRATQQEFLNDIATESRRLAGLIENMVQLANIRAGRLRMESEPVHVGRLVAGAVAAMRQLASERTFQVEVEPSLLAEADPSRIDQVLRNLLHNAVKYSPASSPIEVSARRDDGMVAFGVRDYGSGIADADLALVFERFERTEGARSSNSPGMGLGLYLSRHVIEAHSGRIWIERPPAGGTLVRFTLPEARDDEEVIPDAN